MAEEIEDPIEAIKRRNEERARRLKERIASGEFDKFETPLEEVDESVASGPEAIEAPESDFDLSSFPAPPEPAAIPLDDERAVTEPLEAPSIAPPEMPPEFGPPAEALAEPPLVEEPGEKAFAGLELTELDLEGMGEVIAPRPWDTAEVPAFEAVAPPVEEEFPFEMVPPGLEIEVETGAEAVLEEIAGPPFEEEIVAAAQPAAVSEPALREEEAEAIKATIEEELREIPPAAPPMPPRPKEVPVGVAAEVTPEPGPPAAVEPVVEEEAEIFIGIGVKGNKVRIERRNITLAAAIDLFKSIIDRYQNR
ncbi:MAG TPA: hypothetical protein VMX79_12140 [bacterium]|nr:hypothetical protein [bacterium]